MIESSDDFRLLAERARRQFEVYGEVSVSRLQREFRLKYSDALLFLAYLEAHHFVTPPDPSGRRSLAFEKNRMNREFANDALRKFVGCDSDELAAGTPSSPSVWLFGIEHGTYKSRHEGDVEMQSDDTYSIELQRRWPYNQKAFKLLAAIDGMPVGNWRDFAERSQPFVKGSKGYFKGNLYPYACHDVAEWPESVADETGFADKRDYQAWCRDRRLSVIRSWVEEYRPQVFIGVGTGYRNDFAKAVFADDAPLDMSTIAVAGQERRLFHLADGYKKLVVIPHFSSAAGLNSDALLQTTGKFIAEFLHQ